MSAFDELTRIFRGGGLTRSRSRRRDALGWAMTAVVAAMSLLAVTPLGAVGSAVACMPLIAAAGWACGGRWALWMSVVAAAVPSAAEPFDAVGTPTAVLCRLFVFLHAAAGATLLRAALDRASSVAETDRLTGLLNRAGFMARLEAEVNRARRSHWPLAVGFLDVDNFKQVNDVQGHLAGDEVLKLAGAAIGDNVRNYDAAARFGGDEFVVLWPVLSAAGAEASARRLHDVLTRTVREAGHDVTFSLGVAVFEDVPEPSTVLDSADSLMYEVKRSGKGRVMTRVFRGRAVGRA